MPFKSLHVIQKHEKDTMEEAVMILKTLGAASGRTLSCDLNQCDVFDF